MKRIAKNVKPTEVQTSRGRGSQSAEESLPTGLHDGLNLPPQTRPPRANVRLRLKPQMLNIRNKENPIIAMGSGCLTCNACMCVRSGLVWPRGTNSFLTANHFLRQPHRFTTNFGGGLWASRLDCRNAPKPEALKSKGGFAIVSPTLGTAIQPRPGVKRPFSDFS